MGGKNSKGAGALSAEQRRKLAWAMPAFCVEEYEVTPLTTELVNNCWTFLMSGASVPFEEARQSIPSLVPVVFFYDCFYSKLFELAPEAKDLFRHGLQTQGRMLASMIRFICSASGGSSSRNNVMDEDRLLVSSLQHLARIHNRIGVGAGSYSIMGVVLLYSIRACVGEAYWNDELKAAWVQVFSKIMAIMIPVVVRAEMPSDSVRKVAVCPATGMAGPNPQGPQKDGSQATRPATTHPSPPASTVLRPVSKVGQAQGEEVFDYRTVAEEMLAADQQAQLAAGTACPGHNAAASSSAVFLDPSILTTGESSPVSPMDGGKVLLMRSVAPTTAPAGESGPVFVPADQGAEILAAEIRAAGTR